MKFVNKQTRGSKSRCQRIFETDEGKQDHAHPASSTPGLNKPDLQVLRTHVLARRGDQVSNQERRRRRGGDLSLVGTRRPRQHLLALPGPVPGGRLFFRPALLALVAIKTGDWSENNT